MSAKIPVLDLTQEIAEIRGDIDRAIAGVVDSAQFIGGPFVEEFEKAAAQYLGVKHAIGCNSGTDAILLPLRALGIGPGDEVITTPFTFFATAEPVSLLGATPVFVDIDPVTFNMDVTKVAEAITPRTKAIIAVHLFGQTVDMDALMTLARDHGLVVIEDTAQAFGAEHAGRKAGTIGKAGAYSFFPSKTLGGFGDGGLVSTDDDELAATIKKLRAHGAARKYYNEILGYNSRLDAIQAAILSVKLPRIDAQNARRRGAAARYNELLADLPGIVTPKPVEGTLHAFHQYTLRVEGAGRRDALKGHLAERGIETMVYYPVPVHKLPIYADRRISLPIAEKAAEEVLSLPIWPGMPHATQDRVVEAVREFAKTH